MLGQGWPIWPAKPHSKIKKKSPQKRGKNVGKVQKKGWGKKKDEDVEEKIRKQKQKKLRSSSQRKEEAWANSIAIGVDGGEEVMA